MHFRTARILLLCASLLVGVLIDARPLEDSDIDTAASVENHQQEKRHLEYFDFFQQHIPDNNHIEFPSDIPTEPDNAPTPCHRIVNQTFNVTKYDFDGDGNVIERIEELTRTVVECCEGYESDCITRIEPEPELEESSGSEVYPFDPADPCAGLVCNGASDYLVQCMLVTKCGIDIPLFFDVERGRLAHCDNYSDRNGQPVDLEALKCTGYCAEPNPCRGLACPSHPNAVCFVTGCDCKPTWLLPTGVEVDCTTGKNVPPKRRRRQTESC